MWLPLNLISEIEKLINEHGSIDLLNTKLALLKEHIIELEKENARVIRENAELKQKLSRYEMGEELVEARGAAFKRLPGGGYDKTPYCPICHRPMHSLRQRNPFVCSNKNCGHVSNFRIYDFEAVLNELPPS